MRTVPWTVALGALLLGAAPSFAEEKGSGATTPLALVSHDGTGFVSVRVGEVWQKAEGLRKLTKDNPFMGQVLQEVEKNVGVAPEDVEQAILVFPTEENGDPVAVVSFSKPYDKAKITSHLVPDGQEKKAGGKSYLADEKKHNAVYFVSDRIFAISAPKQLPKFLEQPVSKSGPLDAALKAAAGKHDVVIGLNVVKFLKDIPPEMKPYEPLLKAPGSMATLDLTDKTATLKVRCPCDSEDDAKQAEKAARDGIQKLQAAMPQAIAHVGQLPADAPTKPLIEKLAPFLKDTESALKEAKVTREGKTVNGELSIKTKDPATGTVCSIASFFFIGRSSSSSPPAVEIKPDK